MYLLWVLYVGVLYSNHSLPGCAEFKFCQICLPCLPVGDPTETIRVKLQGHSAFPTIRMIGAVQ